MATIVHARDTMLQNPIRVRYIRGTKVIKASDYPWENGFPSPLTPSLLASTAGAVIGVANPNGDLASIIIPNGNNSAHGITRYLHSASPLSLGTHSINQTIYVKDDGSASYHLHCNLRMRNAADTIQRNHIIRINPITGTVASTVYDDGFADSNWFAPDIKITLLSGNWWKVDIAATVQILTTGADRLSIYFGIVQTNGTQTYTGNGVNGLFLYAPQIYLEHVDEMIGDTYQDLESSSAYRWNGATWDILYSKSQTYKQTTAPTSPADGDIWLKTDGGGNIIEIYQYVNGVWELYPTAISGMLTKESALIECNSGGTVTGSYSNVGGNFIVYAGTTDVSTAGNVVYSVQTETFVNATINTATGVYTLASLTGDVGTVIFRAVYTNAIGITTTIDKKYTLSKSKAGAPGQDGIDGGDGVNGINSATVYLYKRSPTTVTVPSADATYTFATAVLSFAGGVTDGWLTSVTSGTDPLWVTAAVASSNTATAIIDGSDGTDGSDWSTPAKLSENGLNQATIHLYIRTSTTATPATPTSTVTYTFATGALSPTAPNGWSTTAPAPSAGKYLWIISAVAISAGTTDTIASGEWTVPVVFNINGANGFTLIPGSADIRIVNGNGLKKVSGTSAWNAHGYSQEGFSGGAMVSAKFVNIADGCGFGLATNPTASNTLDSIEYCWGVTSAGNVYIKIAGTQVYPATGTVAGSTASVYSIVYDNSSVKFTVNGIVVYTEYNSTPEQTLFFDSSFFHVNAEIGEIVFAPVGSSAAPDLVLSCTRQAFTFDGTGVASPSTQTVVATAALKNTSGNAVFVYRLYNTTGGQIGSAVTMTSTANSATMSVAVFSATPTAKYAVLTATLGSLSDSETISRLDDGSANITIDLTNAAHTLPSYANGYVYNYTGASTRINVFRGTTDVTAEAWTWTPTPSTGVTATMGVGVDKNLLTVSALTDAISGGYVDIAVSRTGYTTQIRRFTLSKSIGGNPNFNLEVNVGTAQVVFPNGVTKPSGSNAWDTDVYTLEAYNSGAYCSAQALLTDKAIMFGLNSDPLTDGNYTSIDYAWYFKNDGTLDSRINGGSQTTHGAYSSSTVLAITYDNKSVYWLKDGIIVRSHSIGSGLKLFFDCSLHTVGGSLKNIAFGPAGSAGIDSVSSSLDKDSVVLNADTEGNVLDFSTAKCTMTVMVGSADESTLWTYDTVATNCTIGSGNDTRAITITAMSADAAQVVFTATKVGSVYPAQIKTFSLSKNRGAIGKIAQRPAANSFHHVLLNTALTATSSCSVLTDGRISYRTGFNTNITIKYSDYYKPTTTNIGSTWWVRMTKLSGVTPTGPASGTWNAMSTMRTWSITSPGNVTAEKSCSLLIEIAETSGGDVISSGIMDLNVVTEV